MIAFPRFFCPKLWENMSGDETERFCATCRHTVYHLANLTLDQRLTILNARRGSVCGRYRIAVRRAYPGKEATYMRRLAKYGAVVAASSAAFITLWQLYDENHRPIPNSYRVAPNERWECSGPIDTCFHEDTFVTLGIVVPVQNPIETSCGGNPEQRGMEVEVQLNLVEASKLADALRTSESASITGPLELPIVKKKKEK